MDASSVIGTICSTAADLQRAAPAVALVWIAAVLVVALVVRGTELVMAVFGITTIAFAIVNFQHLIAAVGVHFSCP